MRKIMTTRKAAEYKAACDAYNERMQRERDARDWLALECEERPARTPCLPNLRHSFNNRDGKAGVHVCDHCRQAFKVTPRPLTRRTTIRGILSAFASPA